MHTNLLKITGMPKISLRSLSVLRTVVVLFLVLVLLISVSYAAINYSVVIPSSGTIVSIEALHVEGNKIKNSIGENISLYGVDYSYFIDGPQGSWINKEGYVIWNSFDIQAMADNLDAMKSWGATVVRTPITVQWWTENTLDFRSNIQTWIQMVAERGLYVEIVPWRVSGVSQPPKLPIPSFDYDANYYNYDNSTKDIFVAADTAVIPTRQAFIDFWVSMATELKDYPNVIFELWNEPYGDKETFMNLAQDCVIAIRETGSQNIIVVQCGFGIGADISGDWTESMSWVTQYPLTDSTGNLAYSTHVYRNSFTKNSAQIYAKDDVNIAFNVTGLMAGAQEYPVYVGEIGRSAWSSDQDNESEWFDNCLSVFEENGINYSVWWWWTVGSQWGLFTSGSSDPPVPNYAPSIAGEILLKHMNSTQV